MKRVVTGFIALLLLNTTACASLQTVGPVATAQEIDEETRFHHQYLRESRAKGHVISGSNTQPAKPRLEQVAQRIAPAAIALCEDMNMPDPQGCAYSIHLKRSADDKPMAYTDGEDVFITNSMIRHTANDDELALVLAHEFAHNIMDHNSSVTQNMLLGAFLGAAADVAVGAPYDNGSKLGAETAALAYSPAFEHEADYIGMYIAARAGYDQKNATEFWRQISLTLPDNIYFEHTHPTNPERYVVLKKIVAEIEAKKTGNQELVPQFRNSGAQNRG